MPYPTPNLDLNPNPNLRYVETTGVPLYCVTPAEFGARYPGPGPGRTPAPAPAPPAERAPPYLAALSVAVSTLDRPRQLLTAARIPFAEAEGRLWVGPEEACGAVLEFCVPPPGP